MKSIAILSLVLAFFLPTRPVAAYDRQVFTNVLGLLYGTPTIGYEQVLGDENSATGQIGFRNWGGPGYYLSSLGLLGSYRWWLGEHSHLRGVYVGPMLGLNLVDVNYDYNGPGGGFAGRERMSGTTLSVGAEGGYQWVLPSQLTLGLGLNAGYHFGSLNVSPGAPSFSITGLGLGLVGSVGYAF